MKNNLSKWKSKTPILLDLTIIKNDKVSNEKRKRNQIYTNLDYLISLTTLFDFFSLDTFKIILESKTYAQILKKSNVSSEFLLFPFLNYNLEFSNLLQNSNITKTTIGNLFSKKSNLKKENLTQKVKTFLFKESFIKNNIEFQYDVMNLFEKAADNASLRFKTLIITPEILFITLMEEDKTNVSKLIKKIINNDIQWYLLRYKLLKRIHKEELMIRNNVKPNQQFFAYLLKNSLSAFEFSRMLETNTLTLGVSFFRNKLINDILNFDLEKNLQNEINKSIKLAGQRNYST